MKRTRPEYNKEKEEGKKRNIQRKKGKRCAQKKGKILI
jgi:hypothetical protein